VIGVLPLEVRNGSAVTLFSVGLPTLALALWSSLAAAWRWHLVDRYLDLP
jgi:hypothetical protein